MPKYICGKAGKFAVFLLGTTARNVQIFAQDYRGLDIAVTFRPDKQPAFLLQITVIRKVKHGLPMLNG
ncbi:hypothetical protein C7N43_27635 [Sphingobacteriales bacterium UPWRP_1]|nr:hypothetical protein BVG80_09160 [Sphingobacteriales bacterium TSM_CSM]PSJ73739.1 hypothetical protein C7N43_27635 [Sphingobacteriales bacterium UPWRP_1]